MIKHTVKWKNYDGVDVERDFWFHLDEGEIALLELSKKEGLSEWLRVAQENDDPTIVGPAFEKILLGAVGRRVGEDFYKDEQAINSFRWSGAYSALVLWMLQNPVEAGLLINGMLPAAAQEALGKDEIIAKMRAKTEEMALPATFPAEAEVQEVSLNTEASVFPVDPPTLVTETPDFSQMTPEQFQEWQNRQA